MDELQRLEKQVRLLEKKLARSNELRLQLEGVHDRDRLLYKNLMERIEEAHRELKRTQAQLIQSEKMASLGHLTAGIAHEIKNPLNFVNNFAEVSKELVDEIRETLIDHPEALDAVGPLLDDLKVSSESIARNGRRADGIVATMMQHASGSSGKRVQIDLNRLVEEYVDLAYRGRRAQESDPAITVERNLGDDVGTVEVVPQEIGRVLMNLLNNALDAVQERAASESGDYRPLITVSTYRRGVTVHIEVTDNGGGIPRNILDKIFEPFFTTKPTGSATGLGLSLSYDIVTQGHNGTLTAASEGGSGATFTVGLPA
ncbi:MAG TPA: ATP-binding protein [Rhodothermales bacterium]|nr:ATP-binding protein [Rhodothermales bacterium]